MTTLPPTTAKTESRTLELEIDRRAAGAARKFVHDTLHAWERDELVSMVALAVSELVTNAVVHAHSKTRVTLVNYDEAIQVRVHDDDSKPPEIRHPGPEETGGRGILLIEAISAHWGINNDIGGKTVWLDITKS